MYPWKNEGHSQGRDPLLYQTLDDPTMPDIGF
jgi:hypothetical protein